MPTTIGSATAPSYAQSVTTSNDMPPGTMNMAELQTWLKKRVQDEWGAVAGATQQVDSRQQDIKAFNNMKNRLESGAQPPPTPAEFKALADRCTPGSQEQKDFQAAAAAAAGGGKDNLARSADVMDAQLGSHSVSEIAQKLAAKGFDPNDAMEIAAFVHMHDQLGGPNALPMPQASIQAMLDQKWPPTPPPPMPDSKLLAGDCDTMASELDKQNQLAVTQLQQAMGTAQEAMQTVSDIYKSSRDTSMSVVRNLV